MRKVRTRAPRSRTHNLTRHSSGFLDRLVQVCVPDQFQQDFLRLVGPQLLPDRLDIPTFTPALCDLEQDSEREYAQLGPFFRSVGGGGGATGSGGGGAGSGEDREEDGEGGREGVGTGRGEELRVRGRIRADERVERLGYTTHTRTIRVLASSSVGRDRKQSRAHLLQPRHREALGSVSERAAASPCPCSPPHRRH